MQPIISGTTTERIIRTSLLMLMVCGFSAFSFKDGYISYPHQNVEEVIKSLGIPMPDPPPVINHEFTKEKAAQIVDRQKTARASLEAVAKEIGTEPFKHNDNVYFFGHGGHLKLEVLDGRFIGKSKTEWVSGPMHNASSLLFQKLMGFVLAPLGLLLIGQFIRVLTTRATLTDEGLRLRGKPLIPFSAVKGFRAEQYKKKGRLDLDYSLDGQDGSVRLDDYVIKQFRPIVEAICEKTGLENPLPPPKDEDPEDEDAQVEGDGGQS